MHLVKHKTENSSMLGPLEVPKWLPELYKMMVNYTPINKATIENTGPMLHINVILENLREARNVSKSDLLMGYR